MSSPSIAQGDFEGLSPHLIKVAMYLEMGLMEDIDDPYTDDKKLFAENGGGVPLPGISTSLLDPAFVEELDAEFGVNAEMPWLFTSAGEWQGIGSTCGNSSCTDLVGMIPGIADDICMEINDSEGIANPSGNPPSLIAGSSFEYFPHVKVNDPTFQAFVDTMNYSGEVISSGGETNGRSTGCMSMDMGGAGDLNMYFFVLHAQ